MLRANWEKLKVEDVIHNIYDGPHATPKPSESGPVFLGIKNITPYNRLDLSDVRHIAEEDFSRWTKRVLPKKDDLVFIYEATLGRYALIPDDLRCCLGRRMALLRLNSEKVNPNFLLYYFGSSEWSQIVDKNLIVGATVNRIPISEFPQFDLFLPELKEQKAIAKVLSDLDTKIELNNKINAELEEMAKLLYDYWFVQFDFPDAHSKPYKSSGGAMVYNKELKRDIPEGWEVDNLSSWIKNDKSGDWGKESLQGNYTEKVSCIRGADINGLNGKGVVKSPTRYILEKNSHKMLDVGDLIVEISGGSPTQSTGRLAFITEATLSRFDTPLICSNFCKAVTLNNQNPIFNFAFEWNRLYDAGVLFGWEGKTSGIKNFLFDSFVTKHFTQKPPADLMKEFFDKMSPIQKKVQTNLKENQKLSELRDWLLPMLMNGQVTASSSSADKGEAKEYVDKNEVSMAAESISIYNPVIPNNKRGFAKQVLAGKIIKECQEDKDFTPIKLQKILHLSEYMTEANLENNYYYQVAGPYDNKLMHSLPGRMKKAHWFESIKGRWVPMKNNEKIDDYFAGYFGKDNPAFTKIMRYLGTASESKCELISTLYAVWNDRLIKKEEINEDLLIKDFYAWSDRKKNFTPEQATKALEWMKKEGFVPRGFGALIKRKKT